MRYWWVNQNQTYAQEVRGGYLWSPKTNANGARNRFYDNMCDVQPGDVIFSFCNTYIRAIGVATSVAESAPKPTSFGAAGAYWNNEGWFVEVEYRELTGPIRPRDHMRLLGAIFWLRTLTHSPKPVTNTTRLRRSKVSAVAV